MIDKIFECLSIVKNIVRDIFVSKDTIISFSVHPASLCDFIAYLNSDYKYNKYIINKDIYYYSVSIIAHCDNDLNVLVKPGITIKRNIT